MKKARTKSSARSRTKEIAAAATPAISDAAITSIKPAMPSLQGIRERALAERFNIGQTIAELDSLRNEIDATVAFLKANRGDK
jgi:hypothetical protein